MKDNTKPTNAEIKLQLDMIDCKLNYLLGLVIDVLVWKRGTSFIKMHAERYVVETKKAVAEFKRGLTQSTYKMPSSNICPPKRVRCRETGIVYGSIREAGAAFSVSPSSISNQITGISKSCRGCHFEFVEEDNAKNR